MVNCCCCSLKELKIKKLDENAVLPEYKTKKASGMDISALTDVVVQPFERVLVRTGISIELPEGFEGQLRPRSGTALKHAITLVNCVGTIDEDYRGEVCVPVINLSQVAYQIKAGERIAQLVVTPYEQCKIVEVSELSETERGKGGFNSTGKF